MPKSPRLERIIDRLDTHLDTCPECDAGRNLCAVGEALMEAASQPERDPDDDDGQTYADPRDEMERRFTGEED